MQTRLCLRQLVEGSFQLFSLISISTKWQTSDEKTLWIAKAFFFFMSLLVAVEKVFWLHAVFKENPSQLSINPLEQSGCISLLVDRGYKDIRHIINNFTKRLFSNLFLTTFCNLKLPSKYKCSKINQKYNISYNCIKLCVFQDICVDYMLTKMKMLKKLMIWK